MSRIPRAVIDTVEERRAGSCEATGWPTRAVEYHHRRAYGMGGRKADVDGLQNTEHNILGLCPKHHQWAHAHPAAARELGLIVPSSGDPRDVPVLSDRELGRC